MQDKHQDNPKPLHAPVLMDAVLKHLNPRPGETYLDLTAGYGGHAEAVLERTGFAHSVLVDRDSQAVLHLQRQFAGKNIQIIHDDFLNAARQLGQEGVQFDLILADLGVSSPHLDNPSRGFTFHESGPLDMRMDQRQSLTAADLVNKASEAELVEILQSYGQEPKARQIARNIVTHRPLSDTKALANLVAKAWPGHSKVHPATRTFQALRIAVNDELRQLEQAIPIWISLLKPQGRLAIISFHSLEDRLVKQGLQEFGGSRYDAIIHIITGHPVTASQAEIVSNPRARSAKLRAAVKT